MTTTASQRGTANRRRGHTAERDLARWLRTTGFPHAERAVRTGQRSGDRVRVDPGDIDGTPGIVWSVKDCAAEQLAKWLGELAVMQAGCRAVHGLLVTKRRGHADPGRWWCWLTVDDLVRLATDGDACAPHAVEGFPVRVEVGHAVRLLRHAGWGEPLSGPESDPDDLTRVGLPSGAASPPSAALDVETEASAAAAAPSDSPHRPPTGSESTAAHLTLPATIPPETRSTPDRRCVEG